MGHSCLYLWDLKSHLVKRNSAKTKGVQVQPLALLEYASVTEEYIYLSSFKGNLNHIYTPRNNEVIRGDTVFTLSVRPGLRPSVTLCFLNILKPLGRNFMKPCTHTHYYDKT